MDDLSIAPVRCVYVVLTHGLPKQAGRLISAIRRLSPQSGLVVVHDSRGGPPPKAPAQSSVILEHGLNSDWGSWELVEATLMGLQQARARFHAQMYVVLSGQDYPTVDLDAWEAGFVEAGGWQGFAEPVAYRPRWGRPHGDGNDNYTRFHYTWFRLPGGKKLGESESFWARNSRWLLWRLAHYLEPALDVRHVARGRGLHVGVRSWFGPLARSVPLALGSQWLAMDSKALDAVLDRHSTDQRLRRQFQRSIIPDEGYIQTLLHSESTLRSGPALMYVRWNPELDRPETLVDSDLDVILASGSPFCRKLEPGVSDRLMSLLDQRSGTGDYR